MKNVTLKLHFIKHLNWLFVMYLPNTFPSPFADRVCMCELYGIFLNSIHKCINKSTWQIHKENLF